MSRFGWWVALGLGQPGQRLRPGLIVLGGGLIAAGEVLMEPTRRAFAELVEAPSARRSLRIEPAVLGVAGRRHRRRPAGGVGVAGRVIAKARAGPPVR